MKKAFTLVELLVTLMVIGVVAAITIPALMGSTDELQRKVGYKKSVSVLAQAIQLMKAKEIQCEVSNSVELAKCFNQVMLGTLLNNNGEPQGYTNVLLTPDGLAYQFLYYKDYPTNNSLSGKEKSIEKICGDKDSLKKYADGSYAEDWEMYAGNTAYCGVIVDVNGLNKETSKFPDARMTNSIIYGQIAEKPGEAGIIDEDPRAYGPEQFPVIITADGARAVYSKWFAPNSNINRGYSWLYGIIDPLREQSQGRYK